MYKVNMKSLALTYTIRSKKLTHLLAAKQSKPLRTKERVPAYWGSKNQKCGDLEKGHFGALFLIVKNWE